MLSSFSELVYFTKLPFSLAFPMKVIEYMNLILSSMIFVVFFYLFTQFFVVRDGTMQRYSKVQANGKSVDMTDLQ